MTYRKFSVFLALFLIFGISGCSHKSTSHKTPTTKPSGSKTPATMRPYTINGKTYYPEHVSVGDTQKGIASWYGPNFHGKKTSNGERYDMHAMTAAHKTFPMNTMVKVTNTNTGESAVVRINDRGPFVSGRIIDLSKTAAQKLSVYANGTAPVKLEVVGFSGEMIAKNSPKATVIGGNFMVQIGAFRNLSGANSYKAEFDNTSGYRTIVKEFELDGEPIYRVFLGGFKSEDEARDFAHGGPFSGAFIVRE
ncbi:MAG: septal ring lytic transglycosylase RlpA family protein [Campylobacter sp.]|nr:septal ring lytic transglycosylase RlpA family protein [Campylobacter sp.]